MGKIVVSQNVTLDGVVEDPTGEGGFRHGGWFAQMSDADRTQWAGVEFAEARAASALLHGRGTDAYFGQRWNTQTNPWAQCLNSLPKYVVSSTLTEAVWVNSTILKGDAVMEAGHLKERIDGEIIVYASRPLVRALFENDLVDEVRLCVFPIVAGAGKRVFADLSDKHVLRRRDVRPIGEGLVHQVYEVVAQRAGDAVGE